MGMETWIYIGMFIVGIVLFYCYSKTGKLLRCVLFSGVTGSLALGFVWVLAKFTAFTMVFTPFTVLVSTLLGIPGIVSMLVLNLI